MFVEKKVEYFAGIKQCSYCKSAVWLCHVKGCDKNSSVEIFAPRECVAAEFFTNQYDYDTGNQTLDMPLCVVVCDCGGVEVGTYDVYGAYSVTYDAHKVKN